MNTKKYTTSFTTGSLFYHESVKLAELFLDLHDWNTLRDKVISDNLLQVRTLKTLKRICSEIISRLSKLHEKEMNLLVSGSTQDQEHILWIAVCRRYKFIADFAIEVLRQRCITLKTDLNYEDFEHFFNQKSQWHPELDNIKQTTKNKLRQVLFKILREAELINADNTINAAMPSQQVLDAVPYDCRRDLLIFPVFEPDLKGL